MTHAGCRVSSTRRCSHRASQPRQAAPKHLADRWLSSTRAVKFNPASQRRMRRVRKQTPRKSLRRLASQPARCDALRTRQPRGRVCARAQASALLTIKQLELMLLRIHREALGQVLLVVLDLLILLILSTSLWHRRCSNRSVAASVGFAARGQPTAAKRAVKDVRLGKVAEAGPAEGL
jgi:hypothetical protein